MSDTHYKPSGELQGDTKAMPDRGTTTGMTGYDPVLDGMSLGQDDTNYVGSIKSTSKSDAGDEMCNDGR